MVNQAAGSAIGKLFRFIFSPIIFLVSYFRQVVIFAAILIFMIPIIQAGKDEGFLGAMKTAGSQVFLYDVEIAEGMEKLINEPPSSRLERIGIFFSILGPMTTLYFIWKLFVYAQSKAGEFVEIKGWIIAVIILAVIEFLYLVRYSDLPPVPLRGFYLVFTNFLIFLEPVLPIIKIIAWFDVV